MADELMIPASEGSDLEVDEHTTATQFVQARSASIDNAHSARSPSLIIDGEPARCSGGRESFNSTYSQIIAEDMAPIGVPDDGPVGGSGCMDHTGDVQMTDISGVGGTHVAAPSLGRLKMPSHKSILKRAKTTGGCEWSDDDDGEIVSIVSKRRKTMDIEMLDNEAQYTAISPERSVSFVVDEQGPDIEGSRQPDYRLEQNTANMSPPNLNSFDTRKSYSAAPSAVLPQHVNGAFPSTNLVSPTPSTKDEVMSLNRSKRTYERANSVQATPVSQGDTIPMSTGSISRARRAVAISLPPTLSQASNDSTDELSLPVTLQDMEPSIRKVTPNSDRIVSSEQQPSYTMEAINLPSVQSYSATSGYQPADERHERSCDISAHNDILIGTTDGHEGHVETMDTQLTENQHAMATNTIVDNEALSHAGQAFYAYDDDGQSAGVDQFSRKVHDSIPITIKPNTSEVHHPEDGASTKPQPPQIPVEVTSDVQIPPTKQGKNSNKTKGSKSSRKLPKLRAITSDNQDDFDDGEVVGLPKEMYKPRPSRSRSKTFEEYMGTDAPHNEGSSEARESSISEWKTKTPDGYRDSRGSDRDMKSSKSKKKKVKRGKTTSAALLKKTRDSNIEDDVIWLDDDDDDPVIPNNKEGRRPRFETPDEGTRTPPEALINDPPPPNSTSKFAVVITTPRKRPQVDKDVKTGTPRPDAVEPASPTKSKSRSRQNTKKAEQKGQLESSKKSDQKRKRTKSTVQAEAIIEESSNITPESADVATKADQLPDKSFESRASDGIVQPEISNPEPPAEAAKSEPKSEIQGNVDPIKRPVDTLDSRRNSIGSMSFDTPRKPDLKPPEPREKGPNRHSPIPLDKRVPYRVGLSRRVRVAPLLKVIRK
ncbi:hypothetical protein KEM56_006545 [Ascosphaera pollenicola]|nr:hypothetical protein KEM56_006545 [Ascosphaera pollenicola]